jgi:regulator of protease activity HflC (stomatin/prohibitin superfamily)
MRKMKSMIFGLIAMFAISTLFSSCVERIDAGHRGIKVNMYGSGKGVDGITECTGWVFYSPFSTKIYEFPVFVQHKEYTGEDSFVVNSKDGSAFGVSPIVNYLITPEKVPYVFAKYRRELSEIENGFLKTAMYDAFRIAANSYTADSLISHRENFENSVRALLEKQLDKEGFVIQQFTSNLSYPPTFVNAINAKNAAVQQALKAENDVKTAEAEAKIKMAKAEGTSQSMLIQARAEAEANKLKQSTLTPMLIQQQWIEKWDGALPTTSLGSGANMMFNVGK